MTQLGQIICFHQDNPQYLTGLSYLRKAAETGFAQAMSLLSMYSCVLGKNEEAFYWGNKASEQHCVKKKFKRWLIRLGYFEEYVNALISQESIDKIITQRGPIAHQYFTGRAYALKLIDWFDADLEELYHTVFDATQAAVLCWMWVAKQLRVVRDVARLIGEKVFETRKTDQALWLPKKEGDNNKRQKV